MVEEINRDLFDKARALFKEIKEKIENINNKPKVIEFERAIQKLVEDYNTANRENRFVVGGALEILFCTLLKSLGFQCKWLKETRYDIEVRGVKFSLKSNFINSGDIRLINILGNEKATWKEPTLFFISNIGICYADPLMGLQTKHTSDALTIKFKTLKNLFENNRDLVIPILIPKKFKNTETNKIASYDVVKSILEEIDSQHLKKYL